MSNEIVNTVLDRLIEQKMAKYATFTAACHINIVTTPLIEKAKKAGCTLIQVGIESGNNTALKKINRPYTIEKAVDVVNQIKAVGINVHTYYILGQPNETHRTVMDTIKSAVRMNPYEIGLGVMVPYPGTLVYDKARKGEWGYHLKETEWNAYDRYGGNSLYFENLKFWHLIFYQILGYFCFYFLNLRFKDMVIYFKPRIKTITKTIKNCCVP